MLISRVTRLGAGHRAVRAMSNKGKITKPESGKPSAERRRRALTIVGALIVFATFIVKEQIRDYLKDLRDSIAGADSLYTLERDIGTVEIRMVQIDEEIAAVSARQKIAAAGSPTVLQYPREIKTATAMIRERDAALQADFDRLSGLAEKLVFGRDALRDPLARMSDAVSKCHRPRSVSSENWRAKIPRMQRHSGSCNWTLDTY